jgi:prepilin-type N-terminal cleavage/methylation domain-containing protein
MTKFNIKSKKGFTLIELLVVVGILAVLAAIAIPTVAGLINRANASADKTTASEMSNAVERFASEYELYCQDIASGKVDIDSLTAAQSRVFNVTHVLNRANREALESEGGFDGRAIDKHTKYPQNVETARAMMAAYTSVSSDFLPKQADCHYYYSPDCGLVVSHNKDEILSLNSTVLSGLDTNGRQLDENTMWYDLTEGDFASDGQSYYTPAEIDSSPYLFAIGATKPEYVVAKFNKNYTSVIIFKNGSESNGVMCGFTSYSPMQDHANTLQTVVIKEGVRNIGNGLSATTVSAFKDCTKLTNVTLPNNLIKIGDYAFYGCKSLRNIKIPSTVNEIGGNAFACCSKLISLKIPEGVTNITGSIAAGCPSLVDVYIPDTATSISYTAFQGCSSLSRVFIPANVTDVRQGAFYGMPQGSMIICATEEVKSLFKASNYVKQNTTLIVDVRQK